MSIKKRVFLLASVVLCLLIQAQGADKYTDGNRPYEFGFSIDGEQHRHEKKDEKGLVEGEFGFITADGVYHVTVYATDEQGRFKILSMKNIRVKPYPTYTAKQSNSSARQGHSLDLPAEQPSAPSPVSTTTLKPLLIQPPANSCSHCSIPTTPKPAPPALAVPAFSQSIGNSPNKIGPVANPKFPQEVKPQTNFISQPNGASFIPQEGFGKEYPAQGIAQNYPTLPQNGAPQVPPAQNLVPPQNLPSPQQGFGPSVTSPAAFNGLQGNVQNSPFQSSGSPTAPESTYPGIQMEGGRGNAPSDRTPKRLDGKLSVGTQPNSLQTSLPNNQEPRPTKPTLISAQMQIVDKNTDIYRRGPGENEGLPEGLTKDDMSTLLYTFNYTVGFHGHFEEGYTNGVKQGYYFITGRNGVKTRVDYVADSTGFHTKISQEVLDLLSDDVPKPDTEKEEKYGLKGYEFKWLYYPVEARGR